MVWRRSKEQERKFGNILNMNHQKQPSLIHLIWGVSKILSNICLWNLPSATSAVSRVAFLKLWGDGPSELRMDETQPWLRNMTLPSGRAILHLGMPWQKPWQMFGYLVLSWLHTGEWILKVLLHQVCTCKTCKPNLSSQSSVSLAGRVQVKNNLLLLHLHEGLSACIPSQKLKDQTTHALCFSITHGSTNERKSNYDGSV